MTHAARTAPVVTQVSDLLGALGAEEWLLVRLRDQLYAGRWEDIRTDLQNRLAGKPYIFKLVHRIEEDLERIDRLQAMEAEWGINLGGYLPESST
jgi:hypothetical protein